MLALPGSLRLDTALGSPIENALRPRRAAAAMRAARDMVRADHPHVELRSLDSTYNCLGLPFASRRCAIDPDQLKKILIEDGYRQLAAETDAKPGDIVVYHTAAGEAAHVAVVHTKDRISSSGGSPFGPEVTWVYSQWGFDGEYRHRIEDVPSLYGYPAEFWTDRKL